MEIPGGVNKRCFCIAMGEKAGQRQVQREGGDGSGAVGRRTKGYGIGGGRPPSRSAAGDVGDIVFDEINQTGPGHLATWVYTRHYLKGRRDAIPVRKAGSALP